MYRHYNMLINMLTLLDVFTRTHTHVPTTHTDANTDTHTRLRT